MDLEKSNSGMIVDGIASVDGHLDSSAEIVKLEGISIDLLEEGRGLFSYEHKNASNNEDQAFGQEVVGKIITAKKIWKESDCENERHKFFLEKAGAPYLYIVGRLFDVAGHPGAQAIAAAIRDAVKNEEKMVLSYSIEGSTLKREDNILLKTICRRIAITWSPCLKTTELGLISDPGAPAGYDKNPGSSVDIASSTKKSEEDPLFIKFGGHKVEYTSDMLKTMIAGNYNVAPGALTGGAALQREDFGLKAKALQTFNKWDRKKPFREFLKAEMPEVSDDFLNHYTDIVDRHYIKVRKAEQAIDSIVKSGKKLGKKKVQAPPPDFSFEEELQKQRPAFLAMIKNWLPLNIQTHPNVTAHALEFERLAPSTKSSVTDPMRIFESQMKGEDISKHASTVVDPKVKRYARALTGDGKHAIPDISVYGTHPRTADADLDTFDSQYQNHAAVKAVLNDPVLGPYFSGRPKEANLPASLWHSLAAPGHSKKKGLPHEVSLDLAKAEKTLPEQTAQQHHRWVEQYGSGRAFGLFCQYLLPKLMEEKNLSKFEQLQQQMFELLAQAKLSKAEPMSPEELQRIHQEISESLIHGLTEHRSAAIRNPYATPEHIALALKDKASKVRQYAILHPNATPENISQALKDREWITRLNAIQHPNATSENISQALRDEHPFINKIAIEHPKATPEHLYQALRNEDPFMRESAIEHSSMSTELLNSALSSMSPSEIKNLSPLIDKFKQKNDPDSFHSERVHVKMGTNRFRQLRDMVQERGGRVNIKDVGELPPGFTDRMTEMVDIGEPQIKEFYSKKDKKNVQKTHQPSEKFITSDKIQQYIDALPSHRYNVSHATWDGAQRHSGEKSNVFQLNTSNEILQKLKEQGVLGSFRELHKLSFQSGHPVTPTTIGWVRWTHNPKDGGIQVDEVQSDFGQNLSKGLAQHVANGEMSQEQADKISKKIPQDHLDKINQIVFNGRHSGEVLHEAFHEWARQNGKVGHPIAVHTSETKGPLSNLDPKRGVPVHFQVNYEAKPKEMGMKPSAYGELATQNNPSLKGKPQHTDKIRKHEDLLKADPKPPTLTSHARDSVGDFNQTPESQSLAEGLNLDGEKIAKPHGAGTGSRDAWSFWTKHPKHGMVFVKKQPDSMFIGVSEPRQEAIYPNIARNVFGMGQYVPHVALVRHPDTKEEHAIIEHKNGSFFNSQIPGHSETIWRLGKSGELDKMDMMNMVMANPDRHEENYLVDGKNQQLNLIDHNVIFRHYHPDKDHPDYQHRFAKIHGKHIKDYADLPLHPNAVSWALSLDHEKLANELRRYEVPEGIVKHTQNRLKHLQELLKDNNKLSRADARQQPPHWASLED